MSTQDIHPHTYPDPSLPDEATALPPAGPGRPAQGRGGRTLSLVPGWGLRTGVSAAWEQEAGGTEPGRPLVATARRSQEPGVPGLAAGRGRQRLGTPTGGGDRTSRPRFFPVFTKRSTLVVKPVFCKISTIDRDTGSIKQGINALPPPDPREKRRGAARGWGGGGESGGYGRDWRGSTTRPPTKGAAAGPHPGGGGWGVGAARRNRPQAPPPAPAPLCPRATPRPGQLRFCRPAWCQSTASEKAGGGHRPSPQPRKPSPGGEGN